MGQVPIGPSGSPSESWPPPHYPGTLSAPSGPYMGRQSPPTIPPPLVQTPQMPIGSESVPHHILTSPSLDRGRHITHPGPDERNFSDYAPVTSQSHVEVY